MSPESNRALLGALFEQAPFSTIVYDASGHPLAVNSAFRALWGIGIEGARPDYSVLRDTEFERQGLLGYIRRAFDGEAIVTPPLRYAIARAIADRDGPEVWIEAHLSPVRDAAGAIAHVVLVHVDIAAQVAVQIALTASEVRSRNLLSLATALSQAATMDDVANAIFTEGLQAVGANAGIITRVRERQGTLWFETVRSAGYSDDESRHPRRFEATPGRPLSDAVLSRTPVIIKSAAEWRARYPDAFKTGASGYEGYVALPIVVNDRVVASLSLSFRGAREFGEETHTLLATIAQLCAQAFARARAFDAERRARDASQFLAEASQLLATSLDYEATLRNLAKAAVPRFADRCTIDILETPGSPEWPPRVRRIAIAHHDPDQLALAGVVENELPTDWNAAWGLARVIREGVSEFVPEITEEMIPSDAQSAAQLATMRQLKLSSAIIVPLAARGRTLGALTLLMAESGRQYDEADLALAVDLGSRAATAIDNASLYVTAVEAQRAAEHAAERTRRLQALTAVLARALSAEEVIDAIVEHGIVGAGAQAGLVLLLSPDEKTLNAVFSTGYGEAALARLRHLSIDANYPTRDAIRGVPVFLATVEEWCARYDRPIWSQARQQAAALLPLVGSSRRLGVLSIRFDHAHSFDTDEREFLVALAGQCGQALERAHLFAAERAARAEAEEANRAKMEFLATMSHELRTPLNAIGGYADLLHMGVRGPVNSEQRHDLERIQRSQQHLLSLINDVLNFAKLEAGKVEIRLSSVGVRETLDAMDPLIAPQIDAKRLTFESVAPDVTVCAIADEDKLRQVLLNLLSNAIKFTPEGGRITMACTYDAEIVRISIQDTGIGIGGEDLERIFDPFVQLERRLTNVVAGTGLGLAISRDLARAMGGDVTVVSAPNQGSSFTVHLQRDQ